MRWESLRLKAKNLGISTGGPLVVVLNKKDAEFLDIHPLDRLKISSGRKLVTTVADIAVSNGDVPPGVIGLFVETAKELGVRRKLRVDVIPARKPVSLEFIKKKLDGEHLSKKEMEQIVWDIVHNKLSDVELAYFVAATYAHPSTLDETVWLTKAMVAEGEKLSVRSKIILDKHSIGGIPGNRTTLIVVPIMAAAGYTMPKTSSRAITSPAGTADTMEVLAKVEFPLKKMKEIIDKAGACIVWGGALNLAPADDKIIMAEKSLMIDAESQLLASIMAKKNSVSSTHVIIDIPIGPNTKITDRKKADHLKRKFIQIGRKLGMRISVILTDGKEPIGKGIGPSLEARDCLKVLMQEPDRPLDLEKKCLDIAAQLFRMVGKKNGLQLAKSILYTGRAYEKMKEIILLQGGDPHVTPTDIELGKFIYTETAPKGGRIKAINNLLIAKLARLAGAPQNKAAGVFLYRHVGDTVRKGDRLFTIYACSQDKLDYAKKMLDEMNTIISF